MQSDLRVTLDGRLFPPLIKPKALCQYTRQWSAMLDAGMSMTVALGILEEQCRDDVWIRSEWKLWKEIREGVESGVPLSECLDQHPDTFNPIYRGLIRAAEASGKLPEMMNRIATYMEKIQKIKNKVLASLAYPAVVSSVAFGVMMLLLVVIVPRFVEIFNDLLSGQPLPTITIIVLAISRFCKDYFALIGFGIFAAAAAFRMVRRSEKGRYVTDHLVLRVPVFGKLIRKVVIGQFAATLSTLLDSGLPALRALDTLYSATANEVMKRVVRPIHESILEGESFSEPMANSGVFPVMVVRWIEVGEQTRSLPDMLHRLSVQYEEETENAIEAMISLIEPSMIVLLATLVGSIVLSLFLPIVRIIEQLGS